MNTKKIASVALATTMVFSLAGCSAMSETQKEYASALDSVGYTKISPNDSEDKYNDNIEDGLYLTVTKKSDLKDFCKILGAGDADDMKSLFMGLRQTDDDSIFKVAVFEFGDEDLAEDFFDELIDCEVDSFKDLGMTMEELSNFLGDDFAINDEEDDLWQVAYSIDMAMKVEGYAEVRLDGTAVIWIEAVAFEDDIDTIIGDMDDFYDEMDTDSPKELLK